MILSSRRFTPKRVSSILLWLDGSDPLGTGTPPADSTLISTFSNKIGAGALYNGTAAGSARPTYRTNVLYNNHGIVRSDGSANVMNIGNNLTFGTQFSIFLVATPNTGTSDYFFGSTLGTSGNPTILSKFNNGGVQNYEWFLSDGAHIDRQTLSTSGTGLNICEIHQTDNTNCLGIFNGATAFSFTPLVSASTRILSFLFAATAAANFMGTDFAALLVSPSTVLTSLQIGQVRQYLKNYWGTP